MNQAKLTKIPNNISMKTITTFLNPSNDKKKKIRQTSTKYQK